MDLKTIIEQRQTDYELYRQLPAYPRLIFTGEPFNKQHRSVNGVAPASRTEALVGTPCAPGKAVAPVLVVDSPIDADAARGKILVTKTTDPGWVFLLAVAKGVIAEQGSLLSHTAIVSREMGLPSVVGVAGATDRLKTGDKIELDGYTGRIKVLP